MFLEFFLRVVIVKRMIELMSMKKYIVVFKRESNEESFLYEVK